MIKDPYIGMPIVLGHPSKPASSKPPTDNAHMNLPPGHPIIMPGAPLPPGHPTISPGALLPPGHPAVKPGTPLPSGHPNCVGDMNPSNEGFGNGAGASSSNPNNPGAPANPNNPNNSNSANTPGNSDFANGTFDGMVLGSLPIAMAYTPMQQWKTTYSPVEALTTGTVFPELNLPFLGYQRRE